MAMKRCTIRGVGDFLEDRDSVLAVKHYDGLTGHLVNETKKRRIPQYSVLCRMIPDLKIKLQLNPDQDVVVRVLWSPEQVLEKKVFIINSESNLDEFRFCRSTKCLYIVKDSKGVPCYKDHEAYNQHQKVLLPYGTLLQILQREKSLSVCKVLISSTKFLVNKEPLISAMKGMLSIPLNLI